MSGLLTSASLEAAARRVCTMLEHRAAQFNELDAATGDGDMGATLQIVARSILANDEPFPADLGEAFGRLAASIAKTSGSSLSAVIMTGLMSLSRSAKGQRECDVETFLRHLQPALETMQSRSRARFGDKTILDGLKAMVERGKGSTTLAEFGSRAADGVDGALVEFRGRPSQIGRARLSENMGVGLDDPGMVVLSQVIASLREG